jgi:hypothetical protein
VAAVQCGRLIIGKKTKTEQKQDTNQSYNTASSTSVPDTPDIQAYRAWQPQTDPGLSYQYANARNRLNQSFDNPLGGYQTAAMTDAIKRSGNRQLNQDEAQAFRSGAYDVNQQKAGQLGNLASLTRGQNSTASGTGTSNMQGTTTQSESGLGTWLPQVLAGASQIGMAAAGMPSGGGGKNRSTGGGGTPAPSMSPTNPYGLPF